MNFLIIIYYYYKHYFEYHWLYHNCKSLIKINTKLLQLVLNHLFSLEFYLIVVMSLFTCRPIFFLVDNNQARFHFYAPISQYCFNKVNFIPW